MQTTATSYAIPERIDRMPMTREFWRVLLLAGVAWLIESYDIGIVGNVLPSLQRQYSLDAFMVGVLATASTLGIVVAIAPAGHLADRFGRKKLLVVGTAWYAIVSLACAFVSDPLAIIALRFVGGFGMGMVFPIPYGIAAELTPGRFRGAATAMLDAFLSVGYLGASLSAFFIIPQLPVDTGWRWLFVIGALPFIYVPFLLKWMPESPRWLETQGRAEEADQIVRSFETAVERRRGIHLAPVEGTPSVVQSGADVSIGHLFRGDYRKRTLMMWVAFSCILFMFYSVQTYMPTVLVKDGHGLQGAFLITSLIISASIFGKILAAWMVERYGRKPTIVVFGVISAASAAMFGVFHLAALAIPLAMLLSFFGIGIDPVVKIYGAEQYPTRLRETGIGMVEGVGRLFGGVAAPFVMAFILAGSGVPGAYLFVGGLAIIGVAAVAFFGQETMGRAIEVVASVRSTARGGARNALGVPLAAEYRDKAS